MNANIMMRKTNHCILATMFSPSSPIIVYILQWIITLSYCEFIILMADMEDWYTPSTMSPPCIALSLYCHKDITAFEIEYGKTMGSVRNEQWRTLFEQMKARRASNQQLSWLMNNYVIIVLNS
jgi:hypothetical protein